MKHLSEEQMVESYYGDKGRAVKRHLDGCPACASAYAALQGDLAAVEAADLPERAADYGERMWSRVAPLLPERAFAERRRRGISLWRPLSYAAGCAVLVAGAFYFGTVWEQQQHLRRAAARIQEQVHTPAPPPKVVVVVLGDHLDRSERLLVELKHVDSDSSEVAPLTDEARGLLAANREFRDDAEKSGDASLTEALDHLDRLLTEIADHRGTLEPADLVRLKKEMNAEGLLFEVRVLRSKEPHRHEAVRIVAKGGTA